MAIDKDPRISISHIGLFVTFLSLWERQKVVGPVEVFSRDVMTAAKISSTATYQKRIHELDQYGYIRYEPSYYKGKPSKVYITVKA